MTEKKISRRDAIKMLGAVAGTSVLANLPSRWSTPELTTGVLPAHAQTSVACVGNALQIEFLGTDYIHSGNWDVVDPFRWNCSRNNCKYWSIKTYDTGIATVTVTVLDNPSFPVAVGPNEIYWIYLDVQRGEYNVGSSFPYELPSPESSCYIPATPSYPPN